MAETRSDTRHRPRIKPGPLPGRYPRHHCVWLDAGSWRRSLLSPLDSAVEQTLCAWFTAGRPAVVRRLQPQEPQEGVGLGVLLPLAAGKQRLALRLRAQAIVRILPPPRLLQALPAAPAAWQAPLASLEAQTRALGLQLHVYGSLAWQTLTGEPYVSPSSDVDLLCYLYKGAPWRALVRILLAWEGASGLRADGECVGRDGGAVAWRELAQDTRQVLVKHHDGIALLSKGAALDRVFG